MTIQYLVKHSNVVFNAAMLFNNYLIKL